MSLLRSPSLSLLRSPLRLPVSPPVSPEDRELPAVSGGAGRGPAGPGIAAELDALRFAATAASSVCRTSDGRMLPVGEVCTRWSGALARTSWPMLGTSPVGRLDSSSTALALAAARPSVAEMRIGRVGSSLLAMVCGAAAALSRGS